MASDNQPWFAPEPRPIALPESEPSAVQLSYVELAVSPHRNEQPGAASAWQLGANNVAVTPASGFGGSTLGQLP